MNMQTHTLDAPADAEALGLDLSESEICDLDPDTDEHPLDVDRPEAALLDLDPGSDEGIDSEAA